MKLKLAASALILALAACSPQTAPAATETAATVPVALTVPAGDYTVDPTHARIVFELHHMGLGNFPLLFNTYDATVKFDPANVENSSVTATIDPTHLVAAYAGDYTATHGDRFKSWEDDLTNSTNFLNAKQFPQISFASTGVTVTGSDTADVAGELTLLGVTQPVTLHATFTGQTESHPFAKVPAIGFSATGSFKRSAFGMTYLVDNGMVSDEVTFEIDGDFLAQRPAQ
ncbi:MAG: YceI family protein [Hyphomonadaceae bacterium]